MKDDDDYVPPASVITNASKFGPIEITLNTPFRAGTRVWWLVFVKYFSLTGVAHRIPVRAMIMATESYDPTICGPEDDVIEKTDKEGNKVVLLRDWSKPAKHLRCECQKKNELCKCGLGAKPSGYSLQLTWDKTNDINRYFNV